MSIHSDSSKIPDEYLWLAHNINVRYFWLLLHALQTVPVVKEPKND